MKPRCAYCHDSIGSLGNCLQCNATLHLECYIEFGRCPVCSFSYKRTKKHTHFSDLELRIALLEVIRLVLVAIVGLVIIIAMGGFIFL